MKTLMKAAAVAIGLITVSAPLTAEAQSRHDRREWREDRRDDRRDRRDYRRDNRQDRRDWRRDRRDDRRDWRQDRREDRRDWRQDRRATSCGHCDPNDRRGRSDFRDYRGARRGYYYAPSYGYYRVEPRYYGYRWQRGHTLPYAYRSYYVRDPHFYGLRPAPRGYRWVHANNDIVLIALATGLIADMVMNVY